MPRSISSSFSLLYSLGRDILLHSIHDALLMALCQTPFLPLPHCMQGLVVPSSNPRIALACSQVLCSHDVANFSVVFSVVSSSVLLSRYGGLSMLLLTSR
ncbi:unnamed protein product [Linum trigynum]|uniref:Uncharacterized protein n=1 Tax=Linum trigynum TaxID=586398 RepID=A0AAV2CXG9_9ROSI